METPQSPFMPEEAREVMALKLAQASSTVKAIIRDISELRARVEESGNSNPFLMSQEQQEAWKKLTEAVMWLNVDTIRISHIELPSPIMTPPTNIIISEN